jgi:hypothetical protein
MNRLSNVLTQERYFLDELIPGSTVNINGLEIGLDRARTLYPAKTTEDWSQMWTRTERSSFIHSLAVYDYVFKLVGTTAAALLSSGSAANLGELQLCERTGFDTYFTTSLDWMTFVIEALKDSRPMTDWERKIAAESFWSEFD